MVVHICYSSTKEVEAGGTETQCSHKLCRVRGQPEIHETLVVWGGREDGWKEGKTEERRKKGRREGKWIMQVFIKLRNFVIVGSFEVQNLDR